MQKQAFIKSYRKEALSKNKNKSKSDRKALLGDSEIKKHNKRVFKSFMDI